MTHPNDDPSRLPPPQPGDDGARIEPIAHAAQTAISNSTVSNSTITLETHVGDRHYHAAPTWQPRWEPAPAEALALLGAMPRDRVPEVGALPGGSRMPFAPNPHFVGRDATLLALAQALGGERAASGSKAAATGLGGIGKTSVAVEFAHRYGGFFAGGVFWLSFADPAAISSEIAACGGPGLLDLHPSFGALKHDEQVTLVRQAWQQAIPRLLIFDNCEQPELVRDWAPTSGGCRVLITSRRHSWPRGLRIDARRLDVLERAASVLLLRDLAPRLAEAEADLLARELGDFPLAIQLAGGYLAQFPRIPAASYLAELRSDVILAHPSLRGAHDGDVSVTAHDRHVGRTFLVSYQRLEPGRDALALALLARAGCLAPGAPIPLELLLASARLSVADAAGQSALDRLRDLGFVTLDDDAALLHRLVHAFVREVVPAESALAAAEQALLDQAGRINAAGYPAAMQPLLPHLHWAVRQPERRDLALARLCAAAGVHDLATGEYPAARRHFERALAITAQLLGPDQPETAAMLNHLADVLETMGDYAAARPLFEQALAIREQTLGPAHPDTAQSLNNLAYLLDSIGEYGAAQPLYERALAIREQALGPLHPATAESLNNLAFLLRCVGAYAAAQPLYERALAIREQVFGPAHPATAQSINNLASLFRYTGAYAAAQPLYERALAIREQTLGPAHPETAQSLNNLATLLSKTGDYAAARPLHERALAIRERLLGPAHPVTAQSLNNLADVLRATGQLAAAAPLYERAVEIREEALGASHPATAQSLDSLASLLVAMGDYAMALPLYEWALAIREEVFGPAHQDTALSLRNLADLLRATGDADRAQALEARAHAIAAQ